MQYANPNDASGNPVPPTTIRTCTYDSNPIDSTYSQFASGRLTTIQYNVSGAWWNTYTDSVNGAQVQFTGDNVVEMYTYNSPGKLTGKRLRVTRTTTDGNVTAPDLNATWTYNNEGNLTGVSYPGDPNAANPPATYSYSYDGIDRLSGMAETAPSSFTLLSGVTYNAAGQMTQMGSETRTYNAMGQLTNITVPGSMNITYNYSPTQNNGKITSQLDSLTGEQVTYAYDSLNRLISAQAGASWGQGFVYDPFGNLTDKNVLAGSAPPLHVVINAANNHAGGEDANGNPGGLTWDTENRLTSVPEVAPTINVHYSLSYAYDGQNKRMWANTPTVDQISGNVSDSEHYSFYGADGRLMAQFTPVYSPRMVGAPASLTWQNGPARVYFGSRMLGNEDRVGSRGKYFPYGEERNNPALPNDQVKFATYTRDAATGWDYADQRYYTAAWGRFFTPDPYGPSADARTPKSWNRYAYVLGDPINFFDPTGEKCDDDEKTTLTQEILRWIWGDPNYDTSGGLKGIIRRVNEQINGQYGPGTVEWDNHNDIITDLQDNLRKSLTKWDQDKCGPPPVSYAWKWATRGPVTEEEYRGKGKLPISETIGVANSMLNVFLSVGNQLILSVLQRFFEDFNKGLGVTTTTTSAGAVVTSTIYYAIP